MRAGCAVADGKSLRIARFGDNMRDVAVTDGDKVEAMIQLGWSVLYYGIGDLVAYMDKVSPTEIDALVKQYESEYEIVWGKEKSTALGHIQEQARIEIAMRAFFKDNNINAFTTNFQDLHGMKQLPGLACQHLMAEGFGFAGEGDWKTAAMVRTFKVMSAGLGGAGKGDSFMEDYTYHFEKGNSMILGAHMLEVCPTIAAKKPTVEVHQLGIGGKEDPARLVFTGKAGPAICAAIVDFGTRFRCVLSEVNVVVPSSDLPKLPVARVLWKPLPDLRVAAETWILAGGGHHTAFSNIITTEMVRDWAEMVGVELVAIDKNTTVPAFRNELRWNAAAWRK
jgi:L-arabinose isomerase